jgi:DNA repair exonuclease SbcCD ATPase subunit
MSDNLESPTIEKEPITTESKPDEPLGDGGLKALQNERQEKKQLKSELTELKAKLDAIQSEKVQREESEKLKAEELRLKDLESQKQYELALSEQKSSFSQQLAEKQALIESLQQQLQDKDYSLIQTQKNTVLTQLLINHDAIPDAINLILESQSVSKNIKLVNGQIIPVDDSGEQLTNDKGLPISIDEWIENNLKTKNPYLFKGRAISGTGMTPPSTNAKVASGMSADDFLKASTSDLLNRFRK